jgi:hypothetical protein
MEEANLTKPTITTEEFEFGVHQIGVAPETETEKELVESYKTFEAIDVKREAAGTYFGEKVVQLREEIKARGDRNFMARIKQLGISQAKARYWMDKIDGKDPDRHKAKEDPIFDWDTALQKLEALRDAVEMLMQSELVGSDVLVDPLRQLGDLIGYQIVAKGGENDLLQRKGSDGSSVAEETDEGKADSSGSGR